MRISISLSSVVPFLSCFYPVFGNLRFSGQFLITAPPSPEATTCLNANALKRQESCEYGDCAGECLDQGAFCCGPAGSLATSPYWLCDNGACITSVRGTAGIVDCYDPDNPDGTTQSCIDYVPTTTCESTDRCYTCSATVPHCRWETYIESNEPTLSWFSCDASKLPDATFFAATITTDLPSNHPSNTAESNKDSAQDSGSPLSTGAIIGIAVGGGLFIIGSIAAIVFCCRRKRKPKPSPPQERRDDSTQPPMVQQDPQELDGRAYTKYERSELNSTPAYSPQSQPATPFTPPEDYARNVEELHMWAGVQGATRTNLQAQNPGFFVQPPQELYDDTVDQRGSWGYGDDQGHTRPADRY